MVHRFIVVPYFTRPPQAEKRNHATPVDKEHMEVPRLLLLYGIFLSLSVARLWTSLQGPTGAKFLRSSFWEEKTPG